VRTFADLRTGEQPPQCGWSLVVTAGDLSRRRLVRMPWDLESYGGEPGRILGATRGARVLGGPVRLPTRPRQRCDVGGRRVAVQFCGGVGRRRSGIRAAKLIVRFAGIRFLSFIGVVRDGFGRYGDRFVSTVVVGCGLLIRAMMLVSPRWPLV
jgi:hypothetical protein